jgi:hypothetical protein
MVDLDLDIVSLPVDLVLWGHMKSQIVRFKVELDVLVVDNVKFSINGRNSHVNIRFFNAQLLIVLEVLSLDAGPFAC